MKKFRYQGSDYFVPSTLEIEDLDLLKGSEVCAEVNDMGSCSEISCSECVYSNENEHILSKFVDKEAEDTIHSFGDSL